MAELNYSSCKVLVADPSPLIRQGIRNTLYGIGFREIRETASYATISQECGNSDLDLMIVNAEIEGSDTAFLVRNLRTGKLGEDPFVVVIMLITKADEIHIRRVADSGSDGLLLIPFAPDQLMQRVRMLTERRKPFIVTHNYMGPDRRKEARPGNKAAPSFEVPNPLAAHARGAGDRYARLRADVRDRIMRERLVRIAGGIEWECQSIYVAIRDSHSVPDDIVTRLFRVEANCEDLVRTRNQHGAGDAAAMLHSAVMGIKSRHSQATFHDYEGLYEQACRLARHFR